MRLPLTDSRAAWTKLWELSKPHRRQLAAAIVLQILNVGITVLIPFLIGRILDQIVAGTTSAYVTQQILIIAGLVLTQMVICYYGELYSAIFGERMFASIRGNLVHDYLRVPLGDVEAAGAGDLISRGTGDIDSLRMFLNMGLSIFAISIFQVIFIYVGALWTSWQLGLILLAFFPIFMLMLRRYLAHAVPAYKIERNNFARLDTHYNEALEQATTVEAFSMQDAIRRSYLRDMNTVIATDRYTAILRGYLFAAGYWITMTPVVLTIIAGVWMNSLGWVSIGAVTTVVLYALQLEGPLDIMSWLLDVVQTATISLRRIFGVGLASADSGSLGAAVPAVALGVDGSTVSLGAGGSAVPAVPAVPAGSVEVTVENVSFEYRAGAPVLSDVSLTIKAGETLAIVGPSGAGKSTFGRLLAGINHPTHGVIKLDGTPISQIPEAQLRKLIVLVTQEHHVFLGTLRSNLLMVSPQATEAQLWAALDAVEASTWVNALPAGLDTEVGSGKLELSAAQSQQLALARIVLLDPAVLVLDEATSLIDPTSARSLERSMRSVMAGRTVISIAHRLYTSHDADRIAVMIDGSVVELGSHEQLVAAEGEYSSLWHTWQHV